MNYKVYHSGPLMAIRYPAGEARGRSFENPSPARLYVISYNEEMDQISSEVITWSAARALAAADANCIGNAMGKDRVLEAQIAKTEQGTAKF